MPRRDLRRADQLRPVRIERGYQRYADGSALIETGHTRVVCAATVEERVPFFLKGTGTGWVTAEYSMLPGAGEERTAISRGGRRRSSGSSGVRCAPWSIRRHSVSVRFTLTATSFRRTAGRARHR